MHEFWKVAVGVAGLGAIASLVIWSLYRQWLQLDIFQRMTKRQQFVLFVLFLVLTFVFAIAALITYAVVQTGADIGELITIHAEEARVFANDWLDTLAEGDLDTLADLSAVDAFLFENARVKNERDFRACFSSVSSERRAAIGQREWVDIAPIADLRHRHKVLWRAEGLSGPGAVAAIAEYSITEKGNQRLVVLLDKNEGTSLKAHGFLTDKSTN